METERYNVTFLGNRLCLDFINSASRQGRRSADPLDDFSDLITWMAHAGILDAIETTDALRRWGNSRDGERVCGQARALREDLRGMADRIIAGRAIRQATLDGINELLRHRHGYPQLIQARGTFNLVFRAVYEQASDLLAPIAHDASTLLCAGDLAYIKQCDNPACDLYFYDTTKNHARHWCSMSTCGNRMKVAAHLRRRRGKTTPRSAAEKNHTPG